MARVLCLGALARWARYRAAQTQVKAPGKPEA
jgi:hypothetical protein